MPRGSDFTGSLTPAKVDANCSCEIIQPDLRSLPSPNPAPEARLRGSLPSHQRNGPLSCWGTEPSPGRQKERGHKPPASSRPPQIAQREFSDSRLAWSLEERISDTGREGYLERRCLDYKVKLAYTFSHNLLDSRDRGMLWWTQLSLQLHARKCFLAYVPSGENC